MPRDLRERNESLVEWIRSMYGPGRQFPSARQWALHAGLSASVVNSIEESGYASCKAIIKLARAVKVSPISVLLLAGHLYPEECKGANIQLTPQERDLLYRYRQLAPDVQDAIDVITRPLHERGPDRDSGLGR